MRVTYGTQFFKNLSLAIKWHQARVGIRRLGMPTQWRILKKKFPQRTKAEEYGRAFVDRFSRLKAAEK